MQRIMPMNIRHTTEEDLSAILRIYERARKFMAETGNPRQWNTIRPTEELVREDIKQQRSYVCVNEEEEILGVFVYLLGENIEPTYSIIEDGFWKRDGEYGVIHRIASSGKEKGVGSAAIRWALEQWNYLRIDTHPDNHVMQSLLEKMGFVRCGIIHIVEDNDPRIAYELFKV